MPLWALPTPRGIYFLSLSHTLCESEQMESQYRWKVKKSRGEGELRKRRPFEEKWPVLVLVKIEGHMPPPFAPHPTHTHCILKQGFTWTFPRNQDVTVKLKFELIFMKFYYFFNVLANPKPICFTETIPSMCEP